MDQDSIQLELDTLLHAPHSISTPITASTSNNDLAWNGHDDISSMLTRTRDDLSGIQAVFKSTKQPIGNLKRNVVVVNGTDIGDFSTQYDVHGLYHDELPVIGTCVHPLVTPGFRYRVRVLGDRTRHLFGANATYLQSVGRGYGKRITFEGESLNYNSNYFYSDSNQNGFGFTLVAVQAGDSFVVCDNDGYAMGQGTVRDASFQKEVLNLVQTDGSLVKHVAVGFTCDIRYGPEKHGLMPLCALETLEINGTAVLIKQKHSRKAFTKTIGNIMLPNCGSCVLNFSSK